MTLQGFNGAATLSLRKYPGNADNVGYLILLQWGRNFIVAEMSVLLVQAMETSRLQWGRNFIVAEIRGLCDVAGLGRPASMEPQLYRCGNDDSKYSTNWFTHELQWGRNFIVAEIIGREKTAVTRYWLQWGRNFIVAETGQHGQTQERGSHASMGPQLYRCGNGTLGPIIGSDYD